MVLLCAQDIFQMNISHGSKLRSKRDYWCHFVFIILVFRFKTLIRQLQWSEVHPDPKFIILIYQMDVFFYIICSVFVCISNVYLLFSGFFGHF